MFVFVTEISTSPKRRRSYQTRQDNEMERFSMKEGEEVRVEVDAIEEKETRRLSKDRKGKFTDGLTVKEVSCLPERVSNLAFRHF